MSESYQWDFGSIESGLQFNIVFDGSNFTVTCSSGYMDLNALWFSDGDKRIEGTVTLSKSDSSLNLNGTGITWDDYYKVSSTGLGTAGTDKTSYLTAGESMSFSVSQLDLPPAIQSLLSGDPSQLIIGVRATTTSSGDGKFVDGSGTLLSSYQAPTLAAVSGGTLNDTAGEDRFADLTGKLTGTVSAGHTLSFELAGATATPDGAEKSAGFDLQQSTAYGTLYLSSASGDYKFVANDAAVEALKSTQTLDFVVNATDGTAASATQTLTVTLNGVNDTPELSASLTAHSYTDTAADDSFASLFGTLTTQDRDASDTASYAIAGAESGSYSVGGNSYEQRVVGSYGTLYLNATGAYQFVPDDTAIEKLEGGDSKNESFTLSVTDGSGASASQDLTIHLTGAEDKPVLGAVSFAYHDSMADDSFADTTGTLPVSSRDGDTVFTFALAGSSASSLAGYDLQNASSGYGTLYLNSGTGEYRFVANDTAIEGLQWGNNPHLSYGVTATADGATSDSQSIVIDITGANDAPRDIALLAVTTFANGNGTPGASTAIGTLSVPAGSDPDNGGSYTFSLDGAKVGTLGSASIASDAAGLFAVSFAGALSTTAAGGLADGSIYEVTVKVAQGAGDTLASYSETFSIVTGTNAASESLPGSGFDFSGGDDLIYGRQNVDIIYAGSGNDTVFGQGGNDEIHGGSGVDLLYGGNNNDTFVFASGDTGITLASADTIADFSSADDTIATSLAANNVTIANGTALADFNAFVAAANGEFAAAGGHDAYMAWNAAASGNGWLAIDENGSGALDTGDTLIVLTGVNTSGEFVAGDIA